MKTILLADDDTAIRQTLGQVLILEQYCVIFAATGREAAAKFISHLPDLVLLDLNMPDRDGWEAFQLMNSTHPSVPVVVITARPHQHQRAAEMGAVALLEKPLDIQSLLKTIREHLDQPSPRTAAKLVAA
jgi:DNA-binding response OmpR family regulator